MNNTLGLILLATFAHAAEAQSVLYTFDGDSPGDRFGWSVSGAGDVNGDGYADVIVGAPEYNAGEFQEGAAFVFHGSASGIADGDPTTAAAQLESDQVIARLGWSVSGAGDVNGDGFDDLIVGARGDDPNGERSGASFVVFGGDFSGAATQVGTVGDDTLTGTGADDVIFAGTGNDTLDGAGGTDRLSGGQGADTFIFNDVGGTTTVIDFEGGAGAGDQLDVSAFGFADFAAFQAVASASGPGGHDTLIQLDADDSILLEDFELANLNADDVIL